MTTPYYDKRAEQSFTSLGRFLVSESVTSRALVIHLIYVYALKASLFYYLSYPYYIYLEVDTLNTSPL